MAPKKKGKGKKGQRKKMAPSGPNPAVTPEPAARGQLVGLRSRPDLNGRRVEVKGEDAGKDGAPRFRVELLFGVGAGTVMKVKAANLDLDRDRVLDPAMQTLVAAMQALAPGAPPEEERRDWAGLPEVLLIKVAETHIAQTEAGWAAVGKARGVSDEQIQSGMEQRERDGNCLFVFAMVCTGWRKAQLKVGGPLRTRVHSDVAMPGQVALAKWALAEGCPREHENGLMAGGGLANSLTMAGVTAMYGHMELVRWLIQEQGFPMNEDLAIPAAGGGNVELVKWLRDKGCAWDAKKVLVSASSCGRSSQSQLEVLRWLRENGCDWVADGMYALLACGSAANGGHLELLKFLRAEGSPWGDMTCNCAVRNGHVEVLRWARENGCPWDAETRDRAAAELGYTDNFGNLVA